MRIWRLTASRYVDTAFSGEGTRRVGGRWTPPGYRVVHAAGSIALAMLETLVHVDPSVMPAHRVIPVDIPEAVPVTTIAVADLPDDWRRTPPSSGLRKMGKAWLDAGETALMQVPSVIVPEESNYLVNPLHADFTQLAIHAPAPFEIDRCLFGPFS